VQIGYTDVRLYAVL